MKILKEILFELRAIKKELQEISSKEFTVDGKELSNEISSHGKVIRKGGPVCRSIKKEDLMSYNQLFNSETDIDDIKKLMEETNKDQQIMLSELMRILTIKEEYNFRLLKFLFKKLNMDEPDLSYKF